MAAFDGEWGAAFATPVIFAIFAFPIAVILCLIPAMIGGFLLITIEATKPWVSALWGVGVGILAWFCLVGFDRMILIETIGLGVSGMIGGLAAHRGLFPSRPSPEVRPVER
jgi:hypothetical protein